MRGGATTAAYWSIWVGPSQPNRVTQTALVGGLARAGSLLLTQPFKAPGF